jgi:hypothetical protein
MISLKGSKTNGYILEVKDKRFIRDVEITHEELLDLQKILNKKLN